MNSSWCNFCPPRSRVRGSNDVISGKLSHFPAKSACQHLNGCGAQTRAARSKFQKRADAQWNSLSLTCRQNWPKVSRLGSRGQISPGSKVWFLSDGFSWITLHLFMLEHWFCHHCVSLVETVRNIPILTFKGQGQIWGQVRSKKVKLGQYGYRSTRMGLGSATMLFVFL